MKLINIKSEVKIYDNEGYFIKPESKLSYFEKSILDSALIIGKSTLDSFPALLYYFVLDKDGKKVFETIDSDFETSKKAMIETVAKVITQNVQEIFNKYNKNINLKDIVDGNNTRSSS